MFESETQLPLIKTDGKENKLIKFLEDKDKLCKVNLNNLINLRRAETVKENEEWEILLNVDKVETHFFEEKILKKRKEMERFTVLKQEIQQILKQLEDEEINTVEMKEEESAGGIKVGGSNNPNWWMKFEQKESIDNKENFVVVPENLFLKLERLENEVNVIDIEWGEKNFEVLERLNENQIRVTMIQSDYRQRLEAQLVKEQEKLQLIEQLEIPEEFSGVEIERNYGVLIKELDIEGVTLLQGGRGSQNLKIIRKEGVEKSIVKVWVEIADSKSNGKKIECLFEHIAEMERRATLWADKINNFIKIEIK